MSNSTEKTSNEFSQLEPLIPSMRVTGDNPLLNYRMLGTIGSGSFGTVRKAKNIRINKLVAIKRVSVTRKNLFEKEVNILRRIRGDQCHEYLLCAYESFLVGENYYLVTEFIDGLSLAKFIENNDTTDDDNYRLILLISRAVQVIHQSNVAHRDLKPANIMVYRDIGGQIHIKVIDFGLSCFISKDSDAVCSKNRVGTRKYMAPEVIAREVKPSQVKLTDIFSLASIFYYIATRGKPLFSAHGDKPKLEQKIINRNHADLDVLPDYLIPIIKSMLRSPDKRPTIEEVIEQLQLRSGNIV